MSYHEHYENNRLEAAPEIAPYFQDIDRNLAASAYSGTSQSPERAGSLIRSDYALMLIEDRERVEKAVRRAIQRGATIIDADAAIAAWFPEHRAGLKAKFEAYLHSHSNVASSFICGPSNFPSARMQKRGRWADNKYEEIGQFRRTSRKRLLREVLPHGDGTAIRGTDPDAVTKLKIKLEGLQKNQAAMKAANKIVRAKKLSNEEKIEQLDTMGIGLTAGAKMLEGDFCGRTGFPSYMLTNNNANMKRVKDRIAELQREAESGPAEPQAFDTFKVFEDDGRMQFEFDGKPAIEIRTILKQNGFKWSPTRVTWVRQATANGRAAAEYVISALKALTDEVSL